MENNIEVLAVCISEKKGTEKKEVEKIILKEDWGIEGDAHAGKWHRQVSLLAFEKIDAFRKKGAEVDFGAFGENIIVGGVDLRSLPVGTVLEIGEARNVTATAIYIKKWATALCREKVYLQKC